MPSRPMGHGRDSWTVLRKETVLLQPLANGTLLPVCFKTLYSCTSVTVGQITDISEQAISVGSFGDVYVGEGVIS